MVKEPPAIMSSGNAQQPLISAPPQMVTIEIDELDQSNNLITTYIKTSPAEPEDGYAKEYFSSKGSTGEEKTERVDVKTPRQAKNYVKALLNAFLPVGYPKSVTEDYLEYQIYDSLQAFSSSIAGMLSSRAVLEGIGVGSTHTTPTNALLLSILQQSLGRIATILFASRVGPALEAECKFYRLSADVFNDSAMLLDCLSPALPTTQRVILLSGSSILRALCGIAAGSSKASLSLHFAKDGNVADLAAKDSSQETIISLLGMLVGSMLITRVTTQVSTWLTLLTLLSIHLYTNYRAVRAVCIPILNQQRANLVFSALISSIESSDLPGDLQSSKKGVPAPALAQGLQILDPKMANFQETILELRGSVLCWKGRKILCRCKLGVKLSDILDVLPNNPRNRASGSYSPPSTSFSSLLDIFKDLDYILYFHRPSNCIFITLKQHDQSVYLQAWFHAFLLKRYLHSDVLRQKVDRDFESSASWGSLKQKGTTEVDAIWHALLMTSSYVRRLWRDVEKDLQSYGWDMEVNAMLTTGVRTRVVLKREERISDNE